MNCRRQCQRFVSHACGVRAAAARDGLARETAERLARTHGTGVSAELRRCVVPSEFPHPG